MYVYFCFSRNHFLISYSRYGWRRQCRRRQMAKRPSHTHPVPTLNYDGGGSAAADRSQKSCMGRR